MAKLVVNRPRQAADRLRRYRILIDGRVAAMIANGKTAELDLTPGPHRIAVRLDFLRSQPLEIDARRGDAYHFIVGTNLARRRPWKAASFAAAWSPLAIVSLALAGEILFIAPFEGSWFRQFLLPMMVLPSLLLLAAMAIWRDRILYLEPIASPDHIGPWVAPSRSRPLPVRFTIRGLMIAVAILAILLGAGVEWFRFTRRAYFRNWATYHGQLEDDYRRLEQLFHRAAAGWDNTNPNAATNRQAEASAAAVAGYHAAMRRKYEEAAARRAFAVEPDPPAPPRP
jgi:Tfp pilus assembly protein PilE